MTGWHYRYEHHPQALGMAQNWNRAIQLARGQFVMVLHDDDFFLPGGVGRLVNAIQEIGDRHPVLLCGVQVVDQQECILKQQVFQIRQFLSPHDALMRLFSNSSFVRFPAIAPLLIHLLTDEGSIRGDYLSKLRPVTFEEA